MIKEAAFPAWVNVLSLAVSLFVPFGVGLIADTSADIGNGPKVPEATVGHFVPPDDWDNRQVSPAVYQPGRQPARHDHGERPPVWEALHRV